MFKNFNKNLKFVTREQTKAKDKKFKQEWKNLRTILTAFAQDYKAANDKIDENIVKLRDEYSAANPECANMYRSFSLFQPK